MNERFAEWQEWFAARANREQYLIAIISIALVAWLGFIVLVEPASKARTGVDRQIQQARTQVNTTEQQVTALRAQLANDPNSELMRRQQQLQTRNARLETQLDSLAEFIEPAQLLEWMRAMLTGTNNQRGNTGSNQALTLRTFDTFAPQPFLAGSAGATVLQHNVVVELEGSYFAVRDYLQRLQDLPFGFYWQGLDYQVDTYPIARVRLQLYTLSQAEVAVSQPQGGQNAR